jgi:hypothetical protein
MTEPAYYGVDVNLGRPLLTGPTGDVRITGKQLMVLDYMRGNGGVLNGAGFDHLVDRGSFTKRGLCKVLDNLVARGLVSHLSGPPWLQFEDTLTRAGLRASEAAHTTTKGAA